MAKQTWTPERTKSLIEAVAGMEVVTQDSLIEIAATLETTPRSIGSKLRSLAKDSAVTCEVQKASDVARVTWAEADEAALEGFLAENAGTYTYSELGAIFLSGKYTTKQLQGKILSMELTDAVKKAEKAAPVRTYSADEEALYVAEAAKGSSLEVIAKLLGKSIQSVRGKGLSLMREERIAEIPTQEVSLAKAAKADIFEGIELAEMTVDELSEATGSSARGIKNALTRRGISCKNHDGAAKRAKLDKKEDAVEA